VVAGGVPNHFAASWDGTVFLDQSNASTASYALVSAVLTGSRTSTVLSFCGWNVPEFIALDDVSVNIVAVRCHLNATTSSTIYGTALSSAVPALVQGFDSGDTVGNVVWSGGSNSAPTCSLSVSATTPAGIYNCTCLGPSFATGPISSYTILYDAVPVPVRKRASVVVTASSVTVQQSPRGAPPIINASYAGFINGDTAAMQILLPPPCLVDDHVPQYAGIYASQCRGGVAASYDFVHYVAGVVVVMPNGAAASLVWLPLPALLCVLLLWLL
jgi:hypothetical protein